MRPNNNILLLQSLSKREKADLELYLQMPAVKVAPYLRALCSALIAASETDLQSNEAVWQAAYKGEKAYKPATYYAYNSALMVFLKQFLVFLHVQNHDLLQERLQLEVLRLRGLHKFIEVQPEADFAQTDFSQTNKAQSVQNHTLSFEIADQIDRYYEVLRTRDRDTKEHISSAAQALDAHYIVNKLRYIVNAHSHTGILATAIKVSANHLVTELLAEHPDFLQKYPLIYAYSTIHTMQTKAVEADGVRTFWLKLKTFEKQVDRADLDNIYSMIINYCLPQRTKNRAGFALLSYHIYAHAYQYNLLADIESNVSVHYKNVIKLGLECAETSAENAELLLFAQQQRKNVAQNTIEYIDALLAFHANKYEDVISFLANTNFEDAKNQLDAYCLRLRAYYHLQHKSFEYCAESFRKILNRNRDINTFLSYKNFLSIAVSLYHYRYKKTQNGRKIMMEKLEQKTNGNDKNILNLLWLRSEISQLQ
jgi:hypothetical protein